MNIFEITGRDVNQTIIELGGMGDKSPKIDEPEDEYPGEDRSTWVNGMPTDFAEVDAFVRAGRLKMTDDQRKQARKITDAVRKFIDGK